MVKTGKNLWSTFEKLLRMIVSKVLRKKISDQKWNGFIQFVSFGIVGLSNTVIGYAIYAGTLWFLRRMKLMPGTDIYFSQLIMFLLSVAWSFYWNNKMVFRQEADERRNILSALIKTYLSYAFTSLILAEALLHLWVNVLGINEFFAPIITLLITVPLNFVIQKYWAFRRKNV